MRCSSSAIGCSNSRNVVFIGFWLSVFYRQRVARAPQVPGRHRAPWAPGLSQFFHSLERQLASLEIRKADAFLQPEVVERKDVWPQQAEDEEHLGGPAADAAHLDQLGDDRLVMHVRPALHLDRAIEEVLRQVGDVLDLALRQAAGAQLAPFSCENTLRRDCAGAKTDLVPDALRRLDRDLLADDGARQREKGLAATRQEYFRPRADDGGHDGIVPRQRALGAIPVIRLHAAGGSAAGSAASCAGAHSRRRTGRGTRCALQCRAASPPDRRTEARRARARGACVRRRLPGPTTAR